MRKKVVLIASFLIGTGFMKRTDVILSDYAVAEDGSAISLDVQVSSSMGYVRGFKDNGGYEPVLVKNEDTGEWELVKSTVVH